MAFNPFLSMNDSVAPVAPISEVLNPFMISDPEPMELVGENPFATSNPFSDFGSSFEPQPGDTVPVDIFSASEPVEGQTNIFGATTATIDVLVSSHSEPVKPTQLELTLTTINGTGPPHRPRPPPPPKPLPNSETQNLIQSVTGQMDFASSHLLDRIPPTRTPSPVSVRDIHSPSLTPEPAELDEIHPEPLDINKNKPQRPPPTRPPPRPIPPRPAPPPQPPASQQQPDDINLFDAPIAVTVKPTKEAILSLYSAPKTEDKPLDFLSDDVISDVPKESSKECQKPESEVPAYKINDDNSIPINSFETSSLFSDSHTDNPFGIEATKAEHESNAQIPMDYSENASESIVPTTLENSPLNDLGNEVFEAVKSEIKLKNPFASTESEPVETDSSGNPPFINEASDKFEGEPQGIFSPSENNPDATKFKDVFGTENVQEAFGCSVNNQDTNNSTFHISSANSETIYPMQMDAFEAFDTDHGRDFNQTQEDWGSTGVANTFTDDQWGQSDPVTNTSSTDQWGSEPPENTLSDQWNSKPNVGAGGDAFDAFTAKFDSTAANRDLSGAWGDGLMQESDGGGFEAEAFDAFLNMEAPPPPPAVTPRLDQQGSLDSNEDNFSVFIRPKDGNGGEVQAVPALAPPPRPQALPESPRVNPFDKAAEPPIQQMEYYQGITDDRPQSDIEDRGGETPPTPLFDEDVSVPLEDFPRTKYEGPGWEMQLRQPNKKKITGQRFWKKIFVRITYQGDNPVVQLYKMPGDKEPFQELPLQACYSVSDIGAQQFDQFGKIFTVKLQYVFYKERPGVRPGQVTKAERITNKLSQFAAYAIQGDYQGVKEFGSDLRKLGLPVEHAPQVSQLFKLGSLNFEDVKQFSCCIEEALFKIPAHRDRALTYKMEEVQITAVDEIFVEQDAEGFVQKQIARVRLFFLGFLSGMPDVEVGLNDLRRQGKEVVGRHDIIPVETEEWIRVEDTEFHACVQPEEFDKCQILRFKPPDACYIELMRFRVRPPKNRELPLQLKAVWCVTGNKVELRADVLVPGFASRKLGQIPCEDVSIRFPIPECWIYLFRVEKHFRYGSVKSAHRRTGKIKGIERFLGAVDTLQESLIEVTSGQAKYEHQHRAIVWRMPRLPKEGQGAYTTHNLVCRMALTSYDQVPAELAKYALVEFTMPMTQVSHMTVRSVSLQNHDNDPPEKYVRYLARHEYMVGIERTSGKEAPTYEIVTKVEPKPKPEPPPPAAPVPAQPSSDSDSD